MAANDPLNPNLIAQLMRALEALICDSIPLSQLQARIDAMHAVYDATFQELDETMMSLIRDVRAARFPVHLKIMRRVRHGHKQIYLYWIENGKIVNGRVEPLDFLTKLQVARYEPLQARYVQGQANHAVLLNIRDTLNLMTKTLVFNQALVYNKTLK